MVVWSEVGDTGEIVQVGRHTDANLPIYLVEFGEKLVVGCLEEEISRYRGISAMKRRCVEEARYRTTRASERSRSQADRARHQVAPALSLRLA